MSDTYQPTVIGRDWQNNTYDHEYKIGFFGKCFGVVLSKRSSTDNHVAFTIVVEDDGTWFVKTSNGGSSSFWLSELVVQASKAEYWMAHNCKKDPLGFGYVFDDTL